jgi:glycine reductase
MRLQLESINIIEASVGPITQVANRVLYVNLDELEDLILKHDRRIKSVKLTLVRPGEKTRIINIVDIIQPRCKLDKIGGDFPGRLGNMKEIIKSGEGRTVSLNGVAVVVSNSNSELPYHPILDTFGFGQSRSRFGGMVNINVHPLPEEGIDEFDFQDAAKVAGLRAAVYLARGAVGSPVDETEIYDLDVPNIPDKTRFSLPKVAYYYQILTPQYDYKRIPEPVLYGSPVVNMFPTLIHPNEILDGALVNPYTQNRNMTTYSIQNNAIIKELYKRHGRDLIFAGVVIAVASPEPIQRDRWTRMATNLISNILGADGVIATKVHGGAAHLDPGMVCEQCEALGIKTVYFIMCGNSKGSLASEILYPAKALNGIISYGQLTETMQLPGQPERIVGGSPDTPYVFDPVRDRDQKVGDKDLIIQATLAGLYDHFGAAKIQAVQY